MKKFLSTIFSVLIFSLCLFSFNTFADQAVWVVSADGKTLTYGSTVYEKYNMPADKIYFPEGEIRLYEVESLKDEYAFDYVSVVPDNNDIVRLHYAEEIYVTEKGKAVLDKFLNGEYSFYLYFDGESQVVDFKEEDFSMFIKEENKTEVDVTQIWNSDIFEVRGFDEAGIFAHNCGAVYHINDEYYYIDYDSLDNSFFDAYGAFSYRKGIAPAYKLDEKATKFVSDAKFSSKARYMEYIYPEEEIFFDETDDFSAAVSFWTFSVIFGFIAPAVPLILSVIFANSKKVVYPKRWYILTACSALWIIASVGVVLSLTL